MGVRAAACHCLRALSRSVNVLRTDLVEQQAEEKLVWLLREEENETVKVTASAAVANLLLEFSPMRNVRLFLPFSLSSLRANEELIETFDGGAGPRRSWVHSEDVLVGGQVDQSDATTECDVGNQEWFVCLPFLSSPFRTNFSPPSIATYQSSAAFKRTVLLSLTWDSLATSVLPSSFPFLSNPLLPAA